MNFKNIWNSCGLQGHIISNKIHKDIVNRVSFETANDMQAVNK